MSERSSQSTAMRNRDGEPVARVDFGDRRISQIEWTPDSKFLLFTTVNSGGHAPSYTPAFLFCVADNTFRHVDPAIGSIVAGQFRFAPPDIAIMEVQKGEMLEEEVAVPLATAVKQMPVVTN
jgi:hypothetical protein